MGISLDQWRAVVGCFTQPTRRLGFNPSAILVSRRAVMLCVKVCIMAMLLCCGDIEPNPGPNPARPRGRGRGGATVNTATSRVTRQTTLSQSGDVVDTVKEVRELRELVDNLQVEVNDLRSENSQLRKKVDRLEDNTRRENLIFNGMKESDDRENWSDCEDKVKDFVQQTLGIEDDVEIDHAQRLGRKRPQPPPPEGATEQADSQPERRQQCRPIMVKFKSRKARQKVLDSVRQKGKDKDEALAQSGVRVAEDYSREVRDARRKMFPHMRQMKEDNPEKQVFMRYDKLICGEQTFTFDFENDELTEVSAPT